MLFYSDMMDTLTLFRPCPYSPPRSSHNIFLLQPMLTLFVQSSVIHCIIVPFGQKLNIPVFPADRVLISKLPSNLYIMLHMKFKKKTPNKTLKLGKCIYHTFRGPLALCVLLGSPCLLSWRPQSLRLWWDPLPDWSKTADLLCGKLAPYCHCNDTGR